MNDDVTIQCITCLRSRFAPKVTIQGRTMIHVPPGWVAEFNTGNHPFAPLNTLVLCCDICCKIVPA